MIRLKSYIPDCHNFSKDDYDRFIENTFIFKRIPLLIEKGDSWYTLVPENPYDRIIGIINIDRYFYISLKISINGQIVELINTN